MRAFQDEPWISETLLGELAAASVYIRGQEYFRAGAVHGLRKSDDMVRAKVHGSETYSVILRKQEFSISGECTCPYASEGNFCKHMVAVGLAAMDAAPTSTRAKAPDGKAIRALLRKLPVDTLVDIIMTESQDNEDLQKQLELMVLARGKPETRFLYLREGILESLSLPGDYDWRYTGEIARNLGLIVHEMKGSLNPSQAPALIELCEFAVATIDHALPYIDDSNGELTGIVEDLIDLHYEACALSPPEPIALADRLFHYETTQEWDAFANSVTDYAKFLKTEGIARFKALAESAWETETRDPERLPGDYSRAGKILEHIAEISGDIEGLVRIKSRDLTYALTYVDIAKIYMEAGNGTRALEWAEQGLAAFPKNTDARLVDCVVELWIENGRVAEAVELRRLRFAEDCRLDSYISLMNTAEIAGTRSEQRQWAMERVAQAIRKNPRLRTLWGARNGEPDMGLLVEIALWENDLTLAWNSANEGAVDSRLLTRLAAKLAPEDPEKSIVLYKRVVPLLVAQTNNKSYEEAFVLVESIRTLYRARQKPDDFYAYIEELSNDFKQKRNFMKMLQKLRKP